MDIKFSHYYPKLHGQKTAQLLDVKIRDHFELCEEFIEYDTVYKERGLFDESITGRFILPIGPLIMLIFLGNKNIPFTTVRRFTEGKFSYYNSNIGNFFNIVHVATEEKLNGAGTCAQQAAGLPLETAPDPQ